MTALLRSSILLAMSDQCAIAVPRSDKLARLVPSVEVGYECLRRLVCNDAAAVCCC